MPYPNEFFDAIFHIDAFYFWGPKRMRETCRELFRVLKPNGTLLCGMEFKKFVPMFYKQILCIFRLKKMEDFGILEPNQSDPMNYMVHLEPSGFKNVKV